MSHRYGSFARSYAGFTVAHYVIILVIRSKYELLVVPHLVTFNLTVEACSLPLHQAAPGKLHVAWIPNRCEHGVTWPPTSWALSHYSWQTHTPTDCGFVRRAARWNHLLQAKLDTQDFERIQLSPPVGCADLRIEESTASVRSTLFLASILNAESLSLYVQSVIPVLCQFWMCGILYSRHSFEPVPLRYLPHSLSWLDFSFNTTGFLRLLSFWKTET